MADIIFLKQYKIDLYIQFFVNHFFSFVLHPKVVSPSFSPHVHPCFPSAAPHWLILCLHSERGRPLMGIKLF